jgi:hypothetical protein
LTFLKPEALLNAELEFFLRAASGTSLLKKTGASNWDSKSSSFFRIAYSGLSLGLSRAALLLLLIIDVLFL